jgi:hypothetical protein
MVDGTTEEPKLSQAAVALATQRYIWNHYIHWLCHGFYPPKESGTAAVQFDGDAHDQLHQIFRIMDTQVRDLADILQALGFNPGEVPLDVKAVFEKISRRTGLTEKSHEND